jgi:hypothetical protein
VVGVFVFVFRKFVRSKSLPKTLSEQ